MPEYRIDRADFDKARDYLDDRAGDAEPELDNAHARLEEHRGSEREQAARDDADAVMNGLGHVPVDLQAVADNANKVAMVSMMEDKGRVIDALRARDLQERVAKSSDLIFDLIVESFTLGVLIGAEALWQHQEGQDE